MKVLMNVAVSVDGRIGPPERTHVSFGGPEDRRRMSLVRRRADAIVVGGATFRACPVPMVENPAHLLDPPARARPVINAVVSRGGALPPDARTFTDPRVRPMVLVPSSSGRPAGLPAHVECTPLAEVTPRAILDALAAAGATTVLLECGGNLAGQFFAAGLVDELYVTLVPILLGGVGAPTPLDGPAFTLADAPRLELLEVSIVGSEAYFHYRVARS